MGKKGILIVVSGFSGAGKGTLMKELIRTRKGFALSVSATTRAPREGEMHGREYFFTDRDRFIEMIENDELYEYAEYQGNFYGTPRSFVDERLSEGLDVILEIEVQGAEKIRKKFPEAVLIFVTPPSVSELVRRLTSRGSETEEKIRGRILRAAEEAEYISGYEYVLINDDLDVCVEDLLAVVRAEHTTRMRKTEELEAISEELALYRKGELEL